MDIHKIIEADKVAVGEIVRRGDYLTSTVCDRTKVTNPVIADIIEVRGKYLVVPVSRNDPIAHRDTFDECMSFVRRLVDEG